MGSVLALIRWVQFTCRCCFAYCQLFMLLLLGSPFVNFPLVAQDQVGSQPLIPALPLLPSMGVVPHSFQLPPCRTCFHYSQFACDLGWVVGRLWFVVPTPVRSLVAYNPIIASLLPLYPLTVGYCIDSGCACNHHCPALPFLPSTTPPFSPRIALAPNFFPILRLPVMDSDYYPHLPVSHMLRFSTFFPPQLYTPYRFLLLPYLLRPSPSFSLPPCCFPFTCIHSLLVLCAGFYRCSSLPYSFSSSYHSWITCFTYLVQLRVRSGLTGLLPPHPFALTCLPYALYNITIPAPYPLPPAFLPYLYPLPYPSVSQSPAPAVLTCRFGLIR